MRIRRRPDTHMIISKPRDVRGGNSLAGYRAVRVVRLRSPSDPIRERGVSVEEVRRALSR